MWLKSKMLIGAEGVFGFQGSRIAIYEKEKIRGRCRKPPRPFPQHGSSRVRARDTFSAPRPGTFSVLRSVHTCPLSCMLKFILMVMSLTSAFSPRAEQVIFAVPGGMSRNFPHVVAKKVIPGFMVKL